MKGTVKCHPELVSGSHEIPKQVRNDVTFYFKVVFVLVDVIEFFIQKQP